MVMMLAGSKSRSGKDQDEKSGGKNLFHGTTLARRSPLRYSKKGAASAWVLEMESGREDALQRTLKPQ